MSRSTQLSQSEVFAAIEHLLSQGVYPTSERIRQRLGNRGSPVVLQRFMATWYQQYGPAFQNKVDASRRSLGGEDTRARLSEVLDDLLTQFDIESSTRIVAMDARTVALDQRCTALDSREDALLRRERELESRMHDQETREQELQIALDATRKALATAQAREVVATEAAACFDGLSADLRARIGRLEVP